MSQRVGYFQCVGGASGDMVLGSLLDCGLPIDSLRSVVSALGIDGVELGAGPGIRGAVSGTHVTVSVERDDERRHSIADFVEMVQRSGLPGPVVASAVAIFHRLGRAEATVHDVEPDEVHLHELGSLDTVVDVTCAIAGLAELGVEAVYSSAIPTGSGVVRTAHGATSVPAPATLALLTSAGAPIAPPPGGISDAGEMVTPTGAALLTGMATFEQPEMTVDLSGYGLGTRDPAAYPNALGLWIGTETASASLVLMETNVDDESPQVLAYVVERLLALGAKDAWLTGAQMKKGRTGQVLSALVAPSLEQRAADLIMAETTTLGVRSSRVRRHEAGREQVIVETPLGPIPVKVKKLGGVAIDATPEYEVAKRIALEKRVPLRQVLAAARRAALGVIGADGPES
jgi:pyridinium-3,5-bisthiocarboxylic acid mononucleotide nickel chelatase